MLSRCHAQPHFCARPLGARGKLTWYMRKYLQILMTHEHRPAAAPLLDLMSAGVKPGLLM